MLSFKVRAILGGKWPSNTPIFEEKAMFRTYTLCALSCHVFRVDDNRTCTKINVILLILN